MECINKLFNKEVVNKQRQYNLDILKAISIIAMIICHGVLEMSLSRPDHINELGFFWAYYIFGGYIGVAHAFMMCMGVGIIFSTHNDSKSLIKRGIKLYILAYILNFARYGIPVILYGIATSLPFTDIVLYILGIMIGQDILQFAGLAMILVGILKKLKLNSFHILLISIGMSLIGSFVSIVSDSLVVNMLTGSFFYTINNDSFTSYFPLFTGLLWLVLECSLVRYYCV